MSRIIAGKMIVGDDELHFRDDDAQKKLKDLIVQGKGDSETAVMSQAAATEEFDKLSEEIDDKTGFAEIDLSDAEYGGYTYDGFFAASETHKTIDVDVREIEAACVHGRTINAYCLYHLLDDNDVILKSADLDLTDSTYDIMLRIPKITKTLRLTFVDGTGELWLKQRVTNDDDSTLDALKKEAGVEEIDISNAVDGGYLYDGTLFATNNYKTIDIDVTDVKKLYVEGSTHNQFCLYHFIDKNGKSVGKNAQNYDATNYQLCLDVPPAATVFRFTFRLGFNRCVYAKCYNEVTSDKESIPPLLAAQKSICFDWHINYIDLHHNAGFGDNHIIPGTAKTWDVNGTTDLTQKNTLIEDGIHPASSGNGLFKMIGRTIANQISLISPSYRINDSATQNFWNDKNILWLGTSIPAGLDIEYGISYPTIVGRQLGATVDNNSRGSSCVRINASTGNYDNMQINQFLRSLTRTLAEVDEIVESWDSIKNKILYAPNSLSEADINVMKEHSYENLLLPYLNGTKPMPDLFVLDHGYNDRNVHGVKNTVDLMVKPSIENINRGWLAEDPYMTRNNFANLKTAMNNDLSCIPNLQEFAATLNRNCFIGAMNFIITLIYRYNPHARIVVVGTYL